MQGSRDQPQVRRVVEPDLWLIPLFARLVRAVRAADTSQIDELREQFDGFGWSIRHPTESTACSAEETERLTPRAKRVDPTKCPDTNPPTKLTKLKPEIPSTND